MTRAILAALLAACAPSAPGATYHVDGVRGSDENDGLAAPFRTIGRAVQVLRTSDTLILEPMDEPYRESLPLRVGGTPDAPLVVEGNGAVLSGADPAPKEGWMEADGVFSLTQESEVRFLFGPEACYARGSSPADLEPEQWFWQEGRLHFRPAEGTLPADYTLEMSVRISGVLTNGAGQIIIRDLTCQHFFNDGFNIHGGSAPLWFERIRGLWNGDEGFSAHENSECYVRDAEFSHNQCHGIADIDFARTHYSGITVRDNVLKGILFIGGLHSVIDSEISGSPESIALAASAPAGLPAVDGHPLAGGVSNFRNVVVRSAPAELGAHLRPGSEAVFEHCLLDGGLTPLTVDAGARCYVLNSIITGGQDAEVKAAGEYVADHNLYFPGRLEVGGERYEPNRLGAYREATGNDAHSWLSEPLFIADTLWPSRASRAVGNALNAAYGGMDIGPAPRDARPEEDPSVLPAGATLTETGRIRFTYGFEDANPWSRVYPSPDKTPDGGPISAASELSAEQAHSGARSAKLTATLPPHPGRSWLVKLFSVRMPYHRPVVAMRFRIYGDESGVTFRPRVRDRAGEGFHGPSIAVDWRGWKQIEWDLDKAPPEVMGGDGNGVQECPPVEVVLDITLPPTPDPSTLTLYLDDLEVELAAP